MLIVIIHNQRYLYIHQQQAWFEAFGRSQVQADKKNVLSIS